MCRKYDAQLQSAWQQVQQAHLKLVEIEADAFAQIEDVLTQDQLSQLHEQRSQPESQSNTDSREGNDRLQENRQSNTR